MPISRGLHPLLIESKLHRVLRISREKNYAKLVDLKENNDVASRD